MSGTSDATWGSNKEDGRSATGHLLHSMGASAMWKSKAQPLCSLSSSESKYIVISELVKETSFAKQTVEDFGHKVKVLIPMHCDKQQVINVVRNNASGTRTRRANTRFHFVRELHNEVVLCVHREGRIRATS